MTEPKMTEEKTTTRKKSKNQYFTKVHENAIIQYCVSDEKSEKTFLYSEYIEPAFGEMVDKIVYTYKFTNLPNVDYLKDDCKIWLTTILDKYDPAKRSKAFSYFSVITKNWFIHKVKQNSKKLKREVEIDNPHVMTKNPELIIEHEYESKREQAEFWLHLFTEIDSWEKMNLKENEFKVLKAIKILFESCDDIEIFNKKAIYLYIREITGLNTKQIVNNLNKIRARYRKFKSKWEEGKV
jgi:hypothetical protein